MQGSFQSKEGFCWESPNSGPANPVTRQLPESACNNTTPLQTLRRQSHEAKHSFSLADYGPLSKARNPGLKILGALL